MAWKVLLAVVGVLIVGTTVFVVSNVTGGPEEVPQAPLTPAAVASGSPIADKKFRQGTFTDIDVLHQGDGQAVVYETASGPQLRFENFTVTEGPDVHVYLSKNPQASKDKQLGEHVTLGKLQANKGNQTYRLPADYQDYHSVIVYCRAFQVPFTIADLT